MTSAHSGSSNDEEEAARATEWRQREVQRHRCPRSIRMRGKACARARTTRTSFRSTVSVVAVAVATAATATAVVVSATATTTTATTSRRRRRLARGNGNDASVAAPAAAAAGERRCAAAAHGSAPYTVVEGVRNHADAVSGAHHVVVLEALERADRTCHRGRE